MTQNKNHAADHERKKRNRYSSWNWKQNLKFSSTKVFLQQNQDFLQFLKTQYFCPAVILIPWKSLYGGVLIENLDCARGSGKFFLWLILQIKNKRQLKDSNPVIKYQNWMSSNITLPNDFLGYFQQEIS